MLDAFDFTIFTFVLVDIQRSFAINKALAGLLGTGTAADRWGRKAPILFSIAVWYPTRSRRLEGA